MEPEQKQKPALNLDPGSFNAALFEAYKGGCDCAVCKILRKAVEGLVQGYIPK